MSRTSSRFSAAAASLKSPSAGTRTSWSSAMVPGGSKTNTTTSSRTPRSKPAGLRASGRQERPDMDFGIILGDIPTTVSEKDHFDSILRQAEAAQRAGINHILIGQHFIFERSRWLQPVPVLARLAGELDARGRVVTQVMFAPPHPPGLVRG